MYELSSGIQDYSRKRSWWERLMANGEELKTNGAKINVNTALLLFLVTQTLAGVWWASGLTENLRNLNQNVTIRDNDHREMIRKQDERISTLELQIQTLREKLAAAGWNPDNDTKRRR